MLKDHTVAAAGLPPAGISGMTLLGIGLPDWVMIGTAVYTALATYVLLRDKFYRPWAAKRNGNAGQVTNNS